MFIENLRIDQFSHLRDAFANELHRLSVFGCATDAARDAVRDFVRWMLFGNASSRESSRFVPPLALDHLSGGGLSGDGLLSSRGSISIRHAGRRHLIQRASDSAYGRLTIDGKYDDSAQAFRTIVGHLSPREFDLLYAPLFHRDVHPDALLASVNWADIDFADRRIPNERLRQLHARREQLQAERSRITHHETLQQLTDRRTFLLHRIDELNQQQQLRRRELDRQYNEVCQRIAEVSREVEQRRGEHRTLDGETTRRRIELEEAMRVAQRAKEAELRERRDELNALEHRTQRWRSTLAEVRSRHAEVLEQQRRVSENNRSAASLHADSECLVAGIADKLDRLRRDVGALADHTPFTTYAPVNYPSGTANPPATTYPSGASVPLASYPVAQANVSYVGPALDDLRREVSQVCRTLQARRDDDKRHWVNQEADFLQYCESLMSGWLLKLDEQVAVVRREVAEVESQGLTLVDGTLVDTAVVSNATDTMPVSGDQRNEPYLAGYIDWNGRYVRNDLATIYAHDTSAHDASAYDTSAYDTSSGTHAYFDYLAPHPVPASAPVRDASPIHRGHVEAVRHSCDGYDVASPESDRLLRELIARRSESARELEMQLHELGAFERQRDAIDQQRLQNDDYGLQGIRQELNDLDLRFRAASERERLDREIDQVDSQIRLEKDDIQPSPVLEHASRLLNQLTGGRFSRVRIDRNRHVLIDGLGHQTAMPLDGTVGGQTLRSDVYLALSLAIVADYRRRRGIELPMVLIEPFARTDIERDRLRASVLRDFSAASHQVLIISSHPHHTHELFRSSDHAYADLQPRPSVRPIDPLPRVTEPPLPEPPMSEPPVVAEPVPLAPEPAVAPPREFEDQVRFKRRGHSSGAIFRPPSSKIPWRAAPTSSTSESSLKSARIHGETASVSVPTEGQGSTSAVESDGSRPTGVRSTGVRSIEGQSRSNAQARSSAQARPAVSFAEEQHSLSLTSPIEATGVIEHDVAVWLRESGIESVREFLETATDDLVNGVTDAGFATYPVRRWQDELALRCWVVGLAAADAAMLVASGIGDAESLAEMDSDELYDLLVRTLKSDSKSTYDADRLERLRDRVHLWIRAARRSRTDWVRFRTRSYGKRHWTDRPSRRASMRTDSSRSTSSRSMSSRSRSERSSRSSDGNGSGSGSGREGATRERSSRGTGSRETSSRTSRSSRGSRSSRSSSTATVARADTDRALRFYLDSTDALVDAPSIGARTAEYFHEIGVTTVGDLIKLNAKEAASQIDNRRISEKTIREWQTQAVMACRIPQIRGHDAQILVGCGIKDPTTLARMDPDEVWAIVKPFAKSPEGKRIIRGGKGPDLAEVRDWITWAKSSRTMRSA